MGLMKLGLLFVVVLSQNILLKCEPDWTFEYVCSEFKTETPDLMAGDFEVTRIARGIYALTGFVEIKKDLTDKQRISINTYYSRMGSNFEKAPYSTRPLALSQFINTFYREFVQDAVSDCEENFLRVKTIFLPPLRKNYFYFKNCSFSNDNWPSKMRNGYYNLVTNLTNQAVGYVAVMIKVEQKD